MKSMTQKLHFWYYSLMIDQFILIFNFSVHKIDFQLILQNMSTGSYLDNLYELPNCTICLQELKDDISSLSCGHCFHSSCVRRHLQWRNNCPICRTISMSRDLRIIFYQLTVPNVTGNKQVLKDDQQVEIRRLRSLIDSYEHGAQFCYEKLNNEQQMNMNLKQRLEQVNLALLSVQENFQKTQTRLKRLLKNSLNKQTILLHEIKVLRTLVTVNQGKRKKTLLTMSKFIDEVQKNDRMPYLTGNRSDRDVKPDQGLRVSRSVPPLRD